MNKSLHPVQAFTRVHWGAALLGLFALALSVKHLTSPFADPDLWGYLAFGRLFWENPGFPYQDPFSYTPTKDVWIYHEWLTGVVFYPIYKSFGGGGLQVVKYLLGLGALGVVCEAARRRGASWNWIFISIIFAGDCLALGNSPVRAQYFTHFFLALSILVLDEAQRTQRYKLLLWLAPIQLLWANFHGGFLAGLGIIGVYAVGDVVCRRPEERKAAARSYALALGACLAAVCVNPYGLSYWSYISDAVLMPRPSIEEWYSVSKALSLGFVAPPIYWFLALLALSVPVAGRLLTQKPGRDLAAVLVLGATAYQGLAHIRHIVLFALVFCIFAPAALTQFWAWGRERVALLRGALPPVALAAVLVALFLQLPVFLGKEISNGRAFSLGAWDKNPLSGFYYPLRAMDYMKKQGISGDILSEFTWGEYLLWSLYPQSRVAMCGRYETVYPKRVAKEFFDFVNGREGWRTFLEKYPHQIALFKNTSKAVNLLHAVGGWWEVYRDSGSVLFVHESKQESGRGRRIFGDGAVYEGDYRAGKPHGKGKYTWPDSSYYEGDFQNGVGHGQGVMHYADGAVKSGRFEKGAFVEK